MDYGLFTDEQLLAMVGHGAAPALEALLERHGGRILRFCRRMVADAADAEELTQDVFVRVAGAAESWEPRAKFTTWLYRVATNCCLTHLERRKRSKVVSLGLPEATVDGDEGFRRARGAELAELLERKLRGLPPAQRTAFVLRELEGLSCLEAARVLDIPEGTVKTNVHRARRRLQESMARELDDAAPVWAASRGERP